MLFPCTRWWGQSTEIAKEILPGISSPQRFALFSLAPGGTNRRRRWLPWPFVWRGTSDAAEAAEPSGSEDRGLLFGWPLAALCSQDGTLPQPIHVSTPRQVIHMTLAPLERWSSSPRYCRWVLGTKLPLPYITHLQPILVLPQWALQTLPQSLLPLRKVHLSQGLSPAQQCPPLSPQDLLALLQEHGTSTEGIFQLVAGERASWELREALDSGAQVQLESQPVHLLATILKEFLRKIPSKLLQNELYEDWMSALQKTSRQERLAGLKK
nr:rho GTPase-activating protein 20-like [Columba livia]